MEKSHFTWSSFQGAGHSENPRSRRIPEGILESDYCIACFLIGLSSSALSANLAFKGGTALRRCYLEDYRFSEDLDFTLIQAIPFKQIRAGFNEVCELTLLATGVVFRFTEGSHQQHENGHTFLLEYQGPIRVQRSKTLKVDVTLTERLIFPIESRTILKTYPEFADLPENVTVKAYSMNEIATEKAVALGDRARNEPRDLYDMWQVDVIGSHVNMQDLLEPVREKLEFRRKTIKDLRDGFSDKEPRLERAWRGRLEEQVRQLPDFAEVYRAVQRSFRHAGFLRDR